MQEYNAAAIGRLVLVVGGLSLVANAGVHQGKRRVLKGEVAEAITLARSGKILDAATRLEELATQHPEEPAVLFNLGVAQKGLGQIAAAEATFARVNQLDPTDYDALAEMAWIYQSKGNEDAAFDILEKIPAGEGRLGLRLKREKVWRNAKSKPRMQSLLKRHAAGGTDTSLRIERAQSKEK